MTIAEEIFEVADKVAAALAIARAARLAQPLEALRTQCERAGRAWSGSNLGYHSTVYFDGLQPSPPQAQFSPEWGLIEAWPAHEPHPGWVIMDYQQVYNVLLSRAGIDAFDGLQSELKKLRQTLSDLKESGIALLSAAATDNNADSFLTRQLRIVDELKITAPDKMARALLPGGQVMTRDTRALTQGSRAAPHQALLAVCLSAVATESGLDALEKACRAAASHLGRLEKSKRKSAAVGTNVFIGHGRSKVWLDLKNFIHDRLHLPYDEFNRVPVAGITNTARLSEMLDAAAIALIILTGEDEQADGSVHARENVVHEVGLFQGRIGFTKAIVLLEEGCQQFSNIEGLGQIRFPKGNIGAAFEEIRRVLEREGLLEEQ